VSQRTLHKPSAALRVACTRVIVEGALAHQIRVA
jgi:hypothetical protein